MGQNKHVARLNSLKGKIPGNYNLTHGYFPESKINVLTITPLPLSYSEGRVDTLTKTLYPDGSFNIQGSLEEVTDKLEQFLNSLNDAETTS